MNRQELLDIYSDYLLSAFGQTTATGLSSVLNGSVSHDQITRFLGGALLTSADLWRLVKRLVRQIEGVDGVLILDDSIAEKPYTDENDIICWHYDHTSGGVVKGINFMTALYHRQEISLPVGFALIAKTEAYVDAKSGESKRRSPISKNEHYRTLIQQAVNNRIPFRYVLNDVWFAAAENMMFIKHTVKRDFIMPIKSNRKVALSWADKQQGRYQRVDTLVLADEAVQEIYLEGIDFPLLLVKQLFANEDGSTGLLYLTTSDLTLAYDDITTTYRKRWHVEPYHKSLKQNASLEKSPTQTVVSQSNHFFAALCAFIKLEWLKSSSHLNHFAIKARLYLAAVQTAFQELAAFHPIRLTA
jgi:DDE superfamily endonuclease